MRRVCKPVFTEAGVFHQNKSSTAVSTKIKVHRFNSCKQGLKLTDANKENIVQAEQAHCLLDKKYKYCGGGLYESISEGTDLREVSTAFFPSYHCSYHCSFISASCCQRVKFSLSADFVLCRFYHNFTKLKSVNSVFASNVDMIQSNLNNNKKKLLMIHLHVASLFVL